MLLLIFTYNEREQKTKNSKQKSAAAYTQKIEIPFKIN